MGFFNKLFGKKEKESLDQGLQKTKEGFLSKITKAIAGKSSVDEEVLDNLEEALVGADVGIETTVKIIDRIEKRVAKDKYMNSGELNKMLQEEIEALLVDAPHSNSYTPESPASESPPPGAVVGPPSPQSSGGRSNHPPARSSAGKDQDKVAGYRVLSSLSISPK